MNTIPQFERITMNYGNSLKDIDDALHRQGELLKPFRYTGPEFRTPQWAVHKFNVRLGIKQLELVREGGRGMAPGFYHRLVRMKPKPVLVMSDTDAEMIDFLDQMRGVSGDVLVSGMGMGLVIKAMLWTGRVRSITVVEISKTLIESPIHTWVQNQSKAFGIPVTVHNASCYDWLPPKGTMYDWAWHDIWDTISDRNLPDFRRLRTHYRRNMKNPDRQVCWAEVECKAMADGIPARAWY